VTALFQAIHTHRNLLSVILVQLSFKLYKHTGTYSWVSWCSSHSSYTYTQGPTLGYPGVALLQAINSHKNLLSGIMVQLSFKLYIHRNLLLGILVQLSFKLYLHPGIYSWVSWCSSLSSCTYTQEPTLGYPGAALFQAIPTHGNLLSGILVHLSFKLYIDTGTYSWVP